MCFSRLSYQISLSSNQAPSPSLWGCCLLLDFCSCHIPQRRTRGQMRFWGILKYAGNTTAMLKPQCSHFHYWMVFEFWLYAFATAFHSPSIFSMSEHLWNLFPPRLSSITLTKPMFLLKAIPQFLHWIHHLRQTVCIVIELFNGAMFQSSIQVSE